MAAKDLRPRNAIAFDAHDRFCVHRSGDVNKPAALLLDRVARGSVRRRHLIRRSHIRRGIDQRRPNLCR